jgi:hypothetical protein
MSEPKKTILEKMETYIEDGLQIAVHMKGDALLRDNMHAYLSSQGAIDILLDLQSIIGGGDITSLAEIREDIKKAEEEAKEKGTPYTQ